MNAVLDAGAQRLLAIGYDKASTNKIAEKLAFALARSMNTSQGKEAIFAEIRRREDQRCAHLIKTEMGA